MAKRDCSFLLKEPKSPEKTLIYFYMTTPDEPVKRSFGRHVLPAEWDTEAQRPTDDRDLNKLLDEIDQAIKDLKRDCRRNGAVFSSQMVHDILDVILQEKRKAPSSRAEKRPGANMFTDFKKITAGMEDGSILTPGKNPKRYEPGSIVYFNKCVNILETFFEKKKLKPIYATVTMAVYNEFITYGQGEDWTNSYIGQIIKAWKRLAKIAKDKAWHKNPIFESEGFVKITEDTDDIALDEVKLEKIYTVEVQQQGHDIARDWFVLDSFLGLRVSDLVRVTANDFETEFFQFTNQKTGATVAIPINPIIRAILNKWKGLPPPIADQTLNEYIKEVAKEAKLFDKFIYTVTKGGKKQAFHYQEWEMVSSHTARRSFITNLLRMGVPEAQVMKLAGIKRHETLMKYFKQTPMQTAKDVKKHQYFTGQFAK